MQFRDKVELIFQIFEARIRRPFDDKKQYVWHSNWHNAKNILDKKKIQENVKIE